MAELTEQDNRVAECDALPDDLPGFRRRHPFVDEELRGVEEILQEALVGGSSPMDSLLKPFAQRPGKLLRPTLVILAARFGDYEADRIRRLGAAVELLHLATLIHDDIVDSSPMRRGLPTLHTTQGVKRAVLAGDYVFTRCFELTADFATPESARLLAGAVKRICEVEIDRSRDTTGSLRAYLRRSAGKTALLFLLATAMGSRESGCDEATQEALRRYGYAVGMAFQIIDDILDFDASAAAFGKPVGMDLQSGLVTLPPILALRGNDAKIAATLKQPMNRRRARRTCRLLAENGWLDRAGDVAGDYTERALAGIGTLGPGPEYRSLRDFALSLRKRAY